MNTLTRFAAAEKAQKWFLLMFFCYSLPRLQHPLIPANFGGIDLIPLIAAVALAEVCRVNQSLTMRSNILAFIVIVPAVMLFGNLIGFLVFQDKGELAKGLLQTYRRLGPGLVALLMWQIALTEAQGKRLLMGFIWSLLIGAILFTLVESYNPLGFSNRSRLSGSFMAVGEEGEESDGALFGTIRVAGNAGSQTTYGFLVAAACFLVLDMVRQEKLKKIAGTALLCGLLLCLLLSSAKMVILAAVLLLGLLMLSDRRLWGIMAMIGVVGALTIGTRIDTITEAMAGRGESSLDQRIEKYHHAMQLVQEEPMRLLFGNGWKSGDVGWHSEIVQFLMDFGVIPGFFLMFVLYLVFPVAILKISPHTTPLPSRVALLLIFLVGIAGSLFHDVLMDSYTLFMAAILFGVKYQVVKSEDTLPELQPLTHPPLSV